MPTTTGMKGGGYYNAHSDEQRAALDAFLPWLEEAIAELPLPSGNSQPIGLVDLGSLEGGNAIHAMTRIVKALRRRTNAPLWVFFNDLPSNDFNQLFANLFPNGGLEIPGAGIFPAAIGGTAFDRVVPPRSLHVATTSNTIGFLETIPNARLPNYILPMNPCASREGVSVSEAEREPFRFQAALDLRRFYGARAEELVSGGKLLIEVFGRDQVHSTSDGIYDVLSDALLDTIENGMLPKRIYEELIFPVYFRCLEEMLAPIGRTMISLRSSESKSRRFEKFQPLSIWSVKKPAMWQNGSAAMPAFCALLPRRYSQLPFRKSFPGPKLYRRFTGRLSSGLRPIPFATSFIILLWEFCLRGFDNHTRYNFYTPLDIATMWLSLRHALKRTKIRYINYHTD